MTFERIPGVAATARRGWFAAHKFLLLRRLSQLGFLALFLTGPWFGLWIAKGTLASSLTLNVLPLTDPLVALQSLLARHVPEARMLTGAAIVLIAYLLLGGRTFCSWVCPINPVTDLAGYLRRRFVEGKGLILKPATRYWGLGGVLLASAVTGSIAYEVINPVTTFWRDLVFGGVAGLVMAAMIFLFDLFVAKNGFCGHLCPVGAFYGLIGAKTVLRVSARGRENCDDCLDCFAVCPEPLVIAPALRGKDSPVIRSGACTACGRCADVCSEHIFVYATRFDRRVESPLKTESQNG
ncbi:ferredoxin-type protein NapH [Rhodoblastus acidophilus]|uniref:quinol dehydrogenase ferredoxin subunit NapH n=1 Tax=Rhodoblastus acidophilus TaxID=1074 RepID=UPI002224D9A9|nr:quinol dehydrogenase ferredoxin subunit NapH [Rhodoblastus acidophilus]MCW2282261.1 ferredoxin-type protein NapH [Rhodoblastus acidophilus]MCW2331334.1 ferredoxin-type protein NapH [Rhodoblastus acidophilus]